tara:strand:- start:1024 stop:2181 length:1158 start_codon:yes stop_codon:yes gene_type:complete
MSGTTGLRSGDFDDVSIAHNISLTTASLDGNAGQVIISGGEDEPAVWGGATATSLANPLTIGTNLTLTSGAGSWDASVADTLNATDTTYQGSATINVDTTTNPDTINCIKVPNALTAGSNISFSSGTTYDGSAAITISSTDTDTQLNLTAGNGIVIANTGGVNRTISAKPDEDTIDFDGTELAVLKVPEGLSAGTNLSYSSGSTFDGATARTINLATAPTNLNLTDSTNIIHPPNVFEVSGDLRMSIEMGNFFPNDDNSFFNIGVEDDFSANIHGSLKVLTSSLEVCGYFIIPRNYTATGVRIDATNSSGSSVSRTIMCASVTTYGGTGYTSLNFSGNTNAEFSLSPTMAGASDKIMLITIFTTSTTDHIRGGYIKLTRDASDDY